MHAETEYHRCVHKASAIYVPHAWSLSDEPVNSMRLGFASTKVRHSFLFIMLVDTVAQDVRNELPWELLYTDDLSIIDVTSTDTQNKLESWQVLTDNGLKINVAKTEHLSTRENPLPMKLNGEEPKNVDHFKYVGSVIDKDGTIDRAVDLCVQAAWSSWKN